MCKYLLSRSYIVQVNEPGSNVFIDKRCLFSFNLFSVDYSLLRSNTWNGFSPNLNTRRWISSAELSSVLRPFYFAVHPDLFGQHPEQRVNKISTKTRTHLNCYHITFADNQ